MARFLADHSTAKTEGVTKITNEEFESRIRDLQANIALFPDKKQFDDNVWWDEELESARSRRPNQSQPFGTTPPETNSSTQAQIRK